MPPRSLNCIFDFYPILLIKFNSHADYLVCDNYYLKEMIMTIDELKAELIRIANSNADEEICHGEADDLIINFLAQLDPEIRTIFDSIDKWYA